MKQKSVERPLRVGLISLGCAKNLVDGEIMLGTLLKDGVEIVNDAAQADVVIVNTCSFIDSAQEESVDTILESAEVREAMARPVLVDGRNLLDPVAAREAGFVYEGIGRPKYASPATPAAAAPAELPR